MRATALLLAIFLAIGLLSACGNAEEPTVTQSGNETTTMTEVVTTTSTSASTSRTTSPTRKTTTTTNTTTSTTASTTTTTKPVGASWYKDATWNEDGVLKILAIGNSFSEDSLKYVVEVAASAGIYQVQLGNMYIGGCSLATHLQNAKDDSPSYTYYKTTNWNRKTLKSYKLSDAVKDEDWDFVTFQQASTYSRKAETYDDLEELVNIIAPLCTNPKVELAWHMTWAYQAGYASVTHHNAQMEMYNGIVSAVQNKVLPNEKITKLIPNGTAIQNARSSYMGDVFNRDGYHLSLDTGRLIAAMTYVHALVGIDWKTFDYDGVLYIYPNKVFPRLAAESVRNAVDKPFKVTKSSF